MLSHYGLNRENGFYTLAYRVIDVATTPIAALDSAVLPRFFRLGQAGMPKVIRLAVKSAGASLLLGAGIAVGVLLLAPLIPHLVGRDFSGVLIALRWLCWIPLLRGIHRATGSALTGSGRQNLRTATQLIVAAVNLLLNLWWIPAYGWIGAAWSSLASDGLLALLNSLMLLWVWRRGLHPETECSGGERGIFMNTHGTCAVIITFRPPAAVLDNLAKVRQQVEGLVVVDNGSSAELLVPFRARCAS